MCDEFVTEAYQNDRRRQRHKVWCRHNLKVYPHVKFPKQWKHWMLGMGVKPESVLIDWGRSYPRSIDEWGYCVYKDRRVRFLPHLGKIEVSCVLSEFDRWSNSVEGEADCDFTRAGVASSLMKAYIDAVNYKEEE